MMSDNYHCGLKIVRHYDVLQSGVQSILIAHGSVVDFQLSTGAIVNAANEGCLGGGGIDAAITEAGGVELDNARHNLPVLGRNGLDDNTVVRCRTGNAVVTGPGQFGTIQVPYIIHAVGPNFWNEDDTDIGEELLVSAYTRSLEVASKYDATAIPPITQIAFSLLSAGVYRGGIPLYRIFEISIKAIKKWVENYASTGVVKKIILCAFTVKECNELTKIADKHFSHDT
jgi:O-acetyl-ADP-ribose deacetylase